jgi:predicted nucleic acid-binding protein
MPAVVSDASVLICLGAVQQLQLLKEFYEEVFVPNAAWREVTAATGPRTGAAETLHAFQQGWLKVQTPNNPHFVSSLQSALGAGEAEAIALASELQAALLLIDESNGRKQAKALGLTVTGTVGVLLRAKQAGKLRELKPVLDTLVQQHNFRLARNLYEDVLRQVGEVPLPL